MNSRFRKQAACLAIFALGLLAMTGCGGQSHEAIAESMTKSMDQMADILTSVKDEASAKAAVTKLESLSTTMKELVEKGKALGDPPADVKAKLDAMLKEKQLEIQHKMKTFMTNISANPSLMQIIAPAMQKFGEKMGN